MPHSQPTALQQTVCKFLLDPQYHIYHWGSTILGDSTLWMHDTSSPCAAKFEKIKHGYSTWIANGILLLGVTSSVNISFAVKIRHVFACVVIILVMLAGSKFYKYRYVFGQCWWCSLKTQYSINTRETHWIWKVYPLLSGFKEYK